MDTATKHLLNRWRSLRTEAGLKRAASVARWLWFIGLILALVVAFGLYYGLSSLADAAAAAAMGWVVAERNALKSRISQWPTVANYIDWSRVANDLGDDQEVA